MNVRVSISVTPEVYRALVLASGEMEMNISRTLETLLRESPEFRKYVTAFREMAKREEGITVSSASTGIKGAFYKNRLSVKEEKLQEQEEDSRSSAELPKRLRQTAIER